MKVSMEISNSDLEKYLNSYVRNEWDKLITLVCYEKLKYFENVEEFLDRVLDFKKDYDRLKTLRELITQEIKNVS